MSEMVPGTVTLADLFRVMSAMQSDVARVAMRLEVIDTRNKNADDINHDHEQRLRVLEAAPEVPDGLETRVRALEKLAWKLIGAFAVVNALAVVAEILWVHHK